MPYVLEYPLEDGGTVAVEVGDSSSAVRGWRVEEETERASETIEHAIGRVQPAVDAVLSAFRSGAHAPTEVEIEFGITLTAAAGAVIARTEGEVHFRVTVSWSRA